MSRDKKSKPADLSRILSGVSGQIVWITEPADEYLLLCNSVIRALLESKESIDRISQMVPGCEVRKLSYRKLIVSHRSEARQVFFKVFLPDFSLRWRRGPRFFRPTAHREALWLERLATLGIDVVDVLGTGVLPWRNHRGVQDISFLVTSSSPETGSIEAAMKAGSLSLTQRMAISRAILDLTEKLHASNIGHLDINESNVLYEQSSGKVLLCDLERTSRLPLFQKNRRICQDLRKVRRTLALLLTDPETEPEQALGEKENGAREDTT